MFIFKSIQTIDCNNVYQTETYIYIELNAE